MLWVQPKSRRSSVKNYFFICLLFLFCFIRSQTNQQDFLQEEPTQTKVKKKTSKKKVHYSSKTIQFKKDIVHLIGKAKVRSEEYIMKANKIVLAEERNVLSAFKEVEIINTNDKLTYNGEFIKIYIKEKDVFGKNKCKIKEAENLILCDEFHANDKEKYSYLTNNVHIYQKKDTVDEVLLKSEWGKYEDNREFLFLQSNCSSLSKDLFSLAEYMQLKKDAFIIWYESAELYELKKSKSDKTITKTNSIIYADYAKYFIYTNDNEEEYFLCLTNVVIENLEDNNSLTGEYLKYYPDREVAYMKGKPKYQDEPNEVVVYAEEFEQRKEKDKTILYAKGNVEMISKSNKIKSTIAKFNIKEHKIYMFGNAEITQEEDLYYCNLVEFNTKTEEMNMYGNIRGVIRD